MTTKHTPMPWSLGSTDDGMIEVNAPEHGALAQVVWRMEDDERSPTCEANARLIAAAPYLLAALKELLIQFENIVIDEYEGTDLLAGQLANADSARAAIAKATGQ